MSSEFANRDSWQIEHGWDVFDANGDKVGDVSAVEPGHLAVSKGFFFPKERYVPTNTISGVEHDRVYLNVTKDQLEHEQWDTAPQIDVNDTRDRDRIGTSDDTTQTRGERFNTAATDRTAASGAPTTDTDVTDRMRVPVAEEQLDVSTRQVERGTVRVHKNVVEEQQTVDVPLREEEVHVRRRPVDGRIDDLPTGAFQEEDFEIPVHGEEAEVNKRAVVREEVDIHKHVRERTQPVTETVRREEVQVDDATDGVSVDDTLRRRGRTQDDLTTRG